MFNVHTAAPDKRDRASINGREEEEQPSTRRRRNIYYCCYELLCKWQRRTIYTHTSSEKNQLTKKYYQFAYCSADA